jgi:hypothetical protein
MDATTEPPITGNAQGWTKGDLTFLVFIACVLVAVTWLGVIAYKEALKTEGTKRNGEQWAAWLGQEGPKRLAPNYVVAACAGGVQPAGPVATAAGVETGGSAPAPASAASAPNTWGSCLEYLTTQTEFKDMKNPFTGKAPVFIPACDPADHSLVGSIVFDKITPNPPGSAVATVTSQLLATDPIGDKVLIKIAVCDKGSYAIKIAEVEF